MKTILVTGGAGYIGSHTLIELDKAGYRPVVVDNLINSSIESIKRVEQITGRQIPFYKLDLRDAAALERVMEKYKINSLSEIIGGAH